MKSSMSFGPRGVRDRRKARRRGFEYDTSHEMSVDDTDRPMRVIDSNHFEPPDDFRNNYLNPILIKYCRLEAPSENVPSKEDIPASTGKAEK